VAEKTVEGVRNAADGKVAGLEPRHRTLQADVAKREGQPHGRGSTPGGAGRVRNGSTLKGSKAYGRMNLFGQLDRGRQSVETVSSAGNGEGKTGVGNR
jgi:hypothetical protein